MSAGEAAARAREVGKRQRAAFEEAVPGRLDRLLSALEAARASLAAGEGAAAAVRGVQAAVAGLGGGAGLGAPLKALAAAVQAAGRSADAALRADLDAACAPARLDRALVAQLVAGAFRRDGRVELARALDAEAGAGPRGGEEALFIELREVVRALRARDPAPCLAWAARARDGVPEEARRDLAFRLNRLRYLQLVEAGEQPAAVAFLRRHLAPHAAAGRLDELRRLSGCLLYCGAGAGAAGGLAASPYAGMFEPGAWAEAERRFAQLACQSAGLSQQSPLTVCLAAGCDALPHMLRFVTLLRKRGQEVDLGQTLPFEIDMDRRLQFHSNFVCPVTRELCEPGNPPMLLRCGHVISRESMASILAASRSQRRFKCPTCPQEQAPGEALELRL